jgi:hypothetical protein
VLRLVTPPPKSRVFRTIKATVAPGVTAQESPAREEGALDEPVGAKGVDRVLRAGRVVFAGSGRRQPAECEAPGPNEGNATVSEARLPHAVAFPKMSVT